MYNRINGFVGVSNEKAERSACTRTAIARATPVWLAINNHF